MTVPDPYMTDNENPELSDADFAAMRPAAEVLGEAVVKACGNTGEAGSGSTPVPVSLWLEADVVERFKASGADWRARMAAILAVAARNAWGP